MYDTLIPYLKRKEAITIKYANESSFVAYGSATGNGKTWKLATKIDKIQSLPEQGSKLLYLNGSESKIVKGCYLE